MYALRNALAHDFSLVNPRSRNTPRDIALRHSFNLDLDGEGQLVTFPETPWAGDWNRVSYTHVNLKRFTDVVRQVRDQVYECYDDGTLRLGYSADETRGRYVFTHGASIEEWNEQYQADGLARWGPRDE